MRSTPGSPAYSRVSPPYYPDSPPSPIYVPVSPTYTPGSPAFAPASPVYTPASPASPPTNQNEAQNKRIDPSARSEQGAERVMMGPDIPDQQRGRRLPNYAALASPSPPRNRQAPIVNHHQQHLPSHNGSRPSGSNLNPAQQRGRQDPTYEASTSGVYPSMGLSGFTSSTEMNREVAMSRAVNAQWWAGYWFAMSEVSPRSA
jgi:DNA-directed RNA polymerase II subunit RPB1